MDTQQAVKTLLAQTLQLGPRADSFTPDTALLGALPELDSMAVLALITGLEGHFGIAFADDDLRGEMFATVGSVCEGVAQALASTGT